MCTYIDNSPNPERLDPGHDWSAFTRARLEWLYGPGRAQTPQAIADVERWNALGRKDAA